MNSNSNYNNSINNIYGNANEEIIVMLIKNNGDNSSNFVLFCCISLLLPALVDEDNHNRYDSNKTDTNFRKDYRMGEPVVSSIIFWLIIT